MNLAELVDAQSDIIKEQADIIDSLFLLLLQHVSADELKEVTERISNVGKRAL